MQVVAGARESLSNSNKRNFQQEELPTRGTPNKRNFQQEELPTNEDFHSEADPMLKIFQQGSKVH